MGKFTSISALVISYGLCVTQSLAQNSKVDLGQLSENNGNFRYVAIGSSLSAGVRDGGVYAAAQQTSFPALLAQQMGIKDFKQPLLPGNGTGRKTVTKDKNGNLKFTEIKGLDDTSPNAQLPKVTGDMDNLAVPYQKVLGLDLSEEQTSNWPNSFSKRAFTHGDRFVESGKEKNLSYKSILETELHDFQFYSYEVGIEDFIELFINGAYQQDVSFLTFDREGYFPEDEIFKSLELKGGKGIVLNLPEVYSLPYFNQYSFKTLKSNVPQDIFIERYSKNDVRLAEDEDLFLPDVTYSKYQWETHYTFAYNKFNQTSSVSSNSYSSPVAVNGFVKDNLGRIHIIPYANFTNTGARMAFEPSTVAYPNPQESKEFIKVKFEILENEDVALALITKEGKVIYQKPVENYQEGTYILEIPNSEIQNFENNQGKIVFLHLSKGGQVEKIKLILN